MATDPIDALRDRFSGEILLPAQPGYDDARRVFNGMVVAVRGGGHSVAGLGTCDGGMLIDLAGLDAIAVDAAARTARAGGGVRWGALDSWRSRTATTPATSSGSTRTSARAGLRARRCRRNAGGGAAATLHAPRREEVDQ